MKEVVAGGMNAQEMDKGAAMGLICGLLSWEQMEYAEFQHDTGLEYLRLYIPDDPDGQDLLIRSQIYWQWWLNHWLARDRSYILARVDCNLSTDERRFLYRALNNAGELVRDIYPNRVILEQSYAEMIGRLFDAENVPQ
ncbi:hypothetical protein F0L74_06055 [Chitinophaga agrisoli]|uniref:Uncharacterized protein n=1 Tax=Chitinophaga agrisoli TaxID=2607653 RepID=A0A5B2W482_9BACT|nr:hypothetical protein [Chitinophaga agrisoli]KAA2245520.1 hypothetical protein F0L74_06055 [Chitinophaga agrisoli]